MYAMYAARMRAGIAGNYIALALQLLRNFCFSVGSKPASYSGLQARVCECKKMERLLKPLPASHARHCLPPHTHTHTSLSLLRPAGLGAAWSQGRGAAAWGVHLAAFPAAWIGQGQTWPILCVRALGNARPCVVHRATRGCDPRSARGWRSKNPERGHWATAVWGGGWVGEAELLWAPRAPRRLRGGRTPWRWAGPKAQQGSEPWRQRRQAAAGAEARREAEPGGRVRGASGPARSPGAAPERCRCRGPAAAVADSGAARGAAMETQCAVR